MSEHSVERPIITVPEYAARHGVSTKTVQAWLAGNLLPGAYQSPQDTPRGTWLIPADVPPPELHHRRPSQASLRPRRERHSLAVLTAALDIAEQEPDGGIGKAGALDRIEGHLTDTQVADPAYPALLARLERIRELARQRDAELVARRKLG